MLLVTHLKSLKLIGCSSPSQLWLRLVNWLKSSWCVYWHIKGKMVARARAFESYHAKTIFIKATCYHHVSSSPKAYIIRNVFQRQSQPSALFSSWQSFYCELEDVKQGSPQLSRAQEMGHIILPPAINQTQRRERETGWGKEAIMWTGMRTKKRSLERAFLKCELSILQGTGSSKDGGWGAWKPAGAWVVLLHQLQKEPVFCCLDALCKNLYSCYNLFWFKINLLWQFGNV